MVLLIYLNVAPQSAAFADRDHGGDQHPTPARQEILAPNLGNRRATADSINTQSIRFWQPCPLRCGAAPSFLDVVNEHIY